MTVRQRPRILDGISLAVGLCAYTDSMGQFWISVVILALRRRHCPIGLEQGRASIPSGPPSKPRDGRVQTWRTLIYRTMFPWETATRFDLVLCLNVLQHISRLRRRADTINWIACCTVAAAGPPDRSPLATGAQHIHQAIDHLAHIDRALVAATLGRRNQPTNAHSSSVKSLG